jgi:hypothetical protein
MEFTIQLKVVLIHIKHVAGKPDRALVAALPELLARLGHSMTIPRAKMT